MRLWKGLRPSSHLDRVMALRPGGAHRAWCRMLTKCCVAISPAQPTSGAAGGLVQGDPYEEDAAGRRSPHVGGDLPGVRRLAFLPFPWSFARRGRHRSGLQSLRRLLRVDPWVLSRTPVALRQVRSERPSLRREPARPVVIEFTEARPL